MTINGSGPSSTPVVEGGARKDQLGSSIASENTESATAAQVRIIKTIKAHIVTGDKAADKADRHYRSAGQYLAALKKAHGGAWTEWEELLKTKVGISTGRASELMQVADGRNTVQQLRADKAESVRQVRARASSLRSEENAGDVETATTSLDAKASKQPAKKAGKAEPAAAESTTMVGAKAAPAATNERLNTELEEKLRAAEIKVEGLESEVEELKVERDRLRERVAELEAELNQRPSQENAIAGDFKIRTNRGGADYLDPGDIPVCLRRAKP